MLKRKGVLSSFVSIFVVFTYVFFGFGSVGVYAARIMDKLAPTLKKCDNVDKAIDLSKEFVILNENGENFSFYDNQKGEKAWLVARQVDVTNCEDVSGAAERMANVFSTYLDSENLNFEQSQTICNNCNNPKDPNYVSEVAYINEESDEINSNLRGFYEACLGMCTSKEEARQHFYNEMIEEGERQKNMESSPDYEKNRVVTFEIQEVYGGDGPNNGFHETIGRMRVRIVKFTNAKTFGFGKAVVFDVFVGKPYQRKRVATNALVNLALRFCYPRDVQVVVAGSSSYNCGACKLMRTVGRVLEENLKNEVKPQEPKFFDVLCSCVDLTEDVDEETKKMAKRNRANFFVPLMWDVGFLGNDAFYGSVEELSKSKRDMTALKKCFVRMWLNKNFVDEFPGVVLKQTGDGGRMLKNSIKSVGKNMVGGVGGFFGKFLNKKEK